MDNQEITGKIKEKEIQIANLQKEIQELKKLMIKEPVLTREEKIKVFMDYFKGRDDIYPYLSINKIDPNLKYYVPACENEWKKGICYKTIKKQCKKCPYRKNMPLTKEVIYNHMYADKSVGVYPLLLDDTCYFLALDFDAKNKQNDIKNEVLGFLSVCDQYNVSNVLE